MPTTLPKKYQPKIRKKINENHDLIFIKIYYDPIDNQSARVQVVACRHTGYKP